MIDKGKTLKDGAGTIRCAVDLARAVLGRDEMPKLLEAAHVLDAIASGPVDDFGLWLVAKAKEEPNRKMADHAMRVATSIAWVGLSP